MYASVYPGSFSVSLTILRRPLPVSYTHLDVYKRQAEEDTIQAQQPEVEEETPKPTLREQFEQYKPVVTAAISEDAAYRNARCV